MQKLCPDCDGRKYVGFARRKICTRCRGSGYVERQPPDSPTQPFFEDDLIVVPFAGTVEHQPKEEFSGKGGSSGGGGASAHWSESQSSSNCSSDSPSPSSGCASGGDGGGGGD